MLIEYTTRERIVLTMTAVVGLVGLNGVFLYAMTARPELVREALANPVALAFVLEAFVLVGLLAYLLGRWGVARLSWVWFVGLSIIGGIAFALPVVILWKRRA